MRAGAGVIAAAMVVALSEPARAQFPLSDQVVVCPPGLTAVEAPNGSTTCGKPETAPKPAPGSGGSVSAPTAPVSPSCEAFNAEFTPVYEESLRAYSEAGVSTAEAADRLRQLIANGQWLRDKLRRQAFSSRSMQIRSMLLRQARSVDEDVAAKKKLLASLEAGGERQRAALREDYKERFRELLKKRPQGCAVQALTSGGP